VPSGFTATWRWRQAMIVGCLLFFAWPGAAAIAAAQASAGADANQLHAAIVNGDVESLRYWLEVRRASPSIANTVEPDVTPLERCLRLAARELDTPPRGSRENAAPAVTLRVLQEMVMLLHEHGARLVDADRQRFSGAVLKWYDDAVSPALAPQPSGPTATPADVPAASSTPGLRIGLAGVAITTDVRAHCNGSGHPVYLVNDTQLSVTATVTTYEDGTPTASGDGKRDNYIVDPGTPWRLGCDTTTNGRRVRYELTRWR
jgi:hypothetical protein